MSRPEFGHRKKLQRHKQFLVSAAPPSQGSWPVLSVRRFGQGQPRAPLGTPEINQPHSPFLSSSHNVLLHFKTHQQLSERKAKRVKKKKERQTQRQSYFWSGGEPHLAKRRLFSSGRVVFTVLPTKTTGRSNQMEIYLEFQRDINYFKVQREPALKKNREILGLLEIMTEEAME